MLFPESPASSWTPLGLLAPYTGGGADATISGNTTLVTQFMQYRDLTINSGIVLTAGFSPQVVVCRRLTFGDTASQISANGLGAAGSSTANGGGTGAYTSVGIPTALTANAASLDLLLEQVLAKGGDSTASGTGGAGAAASSRALLLALHYQFLVLGCLGGGGGGAGAAGNGSTSAALGGRRGGAGTSGGVGGSGGSGGSGVGAGGAGGGNTAGTGTRGVGGAGGGVLVVVADTLTGAAGLVTANGVGGGNGVTAAGGGGGGGGGLVLVYCRSATATPTLQANGGAAGSGAGTGSAGGAGGAGLAQLIRSA